MNELIVRPTTEIAKQDVTTLSADQFTQPQKAAIILSALEPADAAEILKGFSQSSLLRFAKEINAQKTVPASVLLNVAGEFLSELGDGTDVKGGADQVRKFLGQFLDDAEVDRIMSDVDGSKQRTVWERLVSAPPPKLATYLQSQHPQTVATILSKLKPNGAAAVLELLDREFAQAAVLRLSRIPSLDRSRLEKIEGVIEHEFLSVISRQAGSVKPAELIGDLMNNISGSARDDFLQQLESADAKLAQEVTRVMFTFTDIADRLQPRDVALIIKDTEEQDLMTAFRHAQDTANPSLDFMLSNLSKRLSERITEDLEAMDAVKDKDGEAAQMKIVAIIQQKAKAGEISLIENDED